jgi:peptidoglycan/LPS O-acetylase OafA/YrhL
MTGFSILPKRFYSLDVLRGVAALSVVLSHWGFFFLPVNKQGVASSLDVQPWFEVLYFFYIKGHAAVQLFFCLSGFIFFWLYSKCIADKAISLRSFAVLRLSRLYPLHFVTLLFVAVGQNIYTERAGGPFAFPFNDAYHFLLNILFASSWGMEKGLSFNGPIWSVSIEILLYAIFFVFCSFFKRNIAALVFAVILGYFARKVNPLIGNGVMFFFVGGLVLIIVEKITLVGDPWKVSTWLPWVTSIVWLLAVSTTYSNLVATFIDIAWQNHKILNHVTLVLFPMTIMSLVLLETKRGTLGKRLSLIGDISYSSYLLHFPLIFTTVLVTAGLGIEQELFNSPWFMILFFLVLVLLSLASHRFFEVPMQRYLRRLDKTAAN